MEKLFGEVILPEEVFVELTANKRYRIEADKIKSKSFITTKNILHPTSIDILKRATGLDQGESAAIILMDELQADLLLMDEAKGRTVSKQMGHRIMGTIGILMAAYEEHELTAEEVKECIEGLKLAGRHIGQKHYHLLLEKLKEEN
nr:DUF3368 domain-containing protein [uncultured Oribacterium sp.]